MNYQRLRNTSTKQIRDKGQLITVLQTQPGTFDTATRKTVRPPAVEVPCYAVMTEFEDKEIDGKTVLRTDRQLLIEAEVTVKEGDRVVVGGETFEIIRFKKVEPGGVLLLQKAQIRK